MGKELKISKTNWRYLNLTIKLNKIKNQWKVYIERMHGNRFPKEDADREDDGGNGKKEVWRGII